MVSIQTGLEQAGTQPIANPQTTAGLQPSPSVMLQGHCDILVLLFAFFPLRLKPLYGGSPLLRTAILGMLLCL